MGDKYFSEIVNINEEVKNYRNAICFVCGTGSGKSHWVKNVLTKKGKVLFITSRRAKVDEDLVDESFTDDIISSICKGRYERILITNHQLCCLIKKVFDPTKYSDCISTFDLIINEFDYIVVDEVHSIISDSTFTDDSFILKKFIEYTAFKMKKITILLSATIEYLKPYLKENGWAIRDLTSKCKFVLPKQVHFIPSAINDRLKRITIEKKKIIYYSNSATNIIDKIYSEFREILSEESIAVILSDKKQTQFYIKFPKAEAICEMTKDSMKRNLMLPSQIRVLLTTSKLREGINLNNIDITNILSESHNLSDNIQYMGRVRNGVEEFYVVADIKQYDSNLNRLEYEYSTKKEINACNEYFQSNINENATAIISLIEDKFQYIRFNYIDNKFQIYDLRYEMQKILSERIQNKWKSDFRIFCNKHDIPLYDLHEAIKSNAQEKIDSFIDKDLFGEQKTEALKNLEKAYKITKKQPTALNKELQAKGIPLRITGVRGKGDNRNSHGIKIIKQK